MADSNKNREEDKSLQAYAALGVGFVCLIVGLPLWWKTTEVYRVQLPYGDVSEIASTPLSYAVEVSIVECGDGIVGPDFGERLKSELASNVNPERGLSAKYGINSRRCSDVEKKSLDASANIHELDLELDNLKGPQQQQHQQIGSYSLYLLPEASKLLESSTASIGVGRSAFMKASRDQSSSLSLAVHIIREVFVNEAALSKAYLSVRVTSDMQADKQSMRGLRSYPGYEITFTLLNPQPDMVRVSWDIENALQKYLKPLLTAFSDYANIKVKSQFLHQTGLGVSANREANGKGFYLSHTQLPHIINPVEAYLGSHVSNDPNLNFIVYIPTRDQSPLVIKDSSGNPSPTNAFLSPRWGGLLIYNVDSAPPNAVLPLSVEIDMKKVMSVFASQLKLLLGIRPKVARDGVLFLDPGNRLLSAWELDLWFRENCIQNIVTSSATLLSLTDLLDKISNIVINDDIGKEVHSGVKFIRKSIDYLQAAKLKDAFLFSKKGMLASEAAFFDQSLLQLLYFPEDQKFAIYIPLFLPVGIPIILSALQAVRWLKNRRKEKTD